MNYQFSNNELFVLDRKNQKIVLILFPLHKEDIVNIKRVFVDESLRGQGIASDAMNALYSFLKENKLKAIATCPYAVSWFERKVDRQDILVSSDEPVVCEF